MNQFYWDVPNLIQVARFDRDTQTVTVRNKLQQVSVDAATQMVSKCV